jgi:hypothetical protein
MTPTWRDGAPGSFCDDFAANRPRTPFGSPRTSVGGCSQHYMEFKLMRTEYDRKTKRAYIEPRTGDADGDDAIAAIIFSFATVAKLSKETLEEDLVRKARHILKRAALAT